MKTQFGFNESEVNKLAKDLARNGEITFEMGDSDALAFIDTQDIVKYLDGLGYQVIDKSEHGDVLERIKQLKQALIETASELGCMINMENERLEQGISSSDLDDPDYFDHETVHKAMRIAKTS